jgi:hypothetical protein
MCTVQGWDVANTLERMRLPAYRSREKGRGGRQLWANDSIYNNPMLEPGRKRHPLSIQVLCSVIIPLSKREPITKFLSSPVFMTFQLHARRFMCIEFRASGVIWKYVL